MRHCRLTQQTIDTSLASHAPKEVIDLATRLANTLQVEARITNERSGYHIYIPCPTCARTRKRRELQDPKYAINASKHLGIGKFHVPEIIGTPRRHSDDKSGELCGCCMRTYQSENRHIFTLGDLMDMSPLSEQIPDLKSSAGVISAAAKADKEQYWLPDPLTQELCPPPAGEMTPITELPTDHPAVYYLSRRGYDMQRLWEQFRTSYCTKEFPSGEKHNVWYRKMPGGWKDTQQGRIIFHALHDGTPMTYQGRYIDYVSEDGLHQYALNPYSNQWDHIASRATREQPWIRQTPFDQRKQDTGTLMWDPSKYKTASNSFRYLMGWDAAIAAASKSTLRYVVLCEGPLDAARVGPGGVALIGKSVNAENAIKIANNFQLVITAFDNDTAGKQATEKIRSQLLNAQTQIY